MSAKIKVILGQLTEKDGKYGKFYSGQLGMTWVTLGESKTPGKWNLYLEQKEAQEQPVAGQPSGAGRIAPKVQEAEDLPF